MKKRLTMILVLMLAIFVVTTAGVLAASQINLVVNGKAVTDVEAKVIDGSTYVPLRAISEMLGAEVGYDSATKTAIINTHQSKEQVSIKDDSAQVEQLKKDIETIKLYSKIANHYRMLLVTDDSISDIGTQMSFSFNYIYQNLQNPLDNAYDQIDFAIKMYNESLDSTNKLIAEASANGIDISNINTVLNHQFDTIDKYKLAYEKLNSFYIQQTDDNYSSFSMQQKEAFEEGVKGRSLALKGYFNFYNKTQN